MAFNLETDNFSRSVCRIKLVKKVFSSFLFLIVILFQERAFASSVMGVIKKLDGLL